MFLSTKKSVQLNRLFHISGATTFITIPASRVVHFSFFMVSVPISLQKLWVSRKSALISQMQSAFRSQAAHSKW